jgi:hypothetical protein
MAMQRISIPFFSPTVGNPGASSPAVFDFDDFLSGDTLTAGGDSKYSATADQGSWLVTVIDSGGGDTEVVSEGVDATQHGLLTLTAGTEADDALTLQKNGEAWLFTADKQIVFETRLRITDVSVTDWFIGLGQTSTTIFTANDVDYVGFGDSVTAGSDIRAVNGLDATGGEIGDATAQTGETSTDVGDMTDATFVTLGFVYDGAGAIRYYVDGALMATHKTNLPAVALTPTICIAGNEGAADPTMEVDYYMLATER